MAALSYYPKDFSAVRRRWGVALSVSPAQLQSSLKVALGHHRAGRLAEAELHYRRLLVVAPRHFDVVNLAGLLAYR